MTDFTMASAVRASLFETLIEKGSARREASREPEGNRWMEAEIEQGKTNGIFVPDLNA